jgi:hypothetical protein
MASDKEMEGYARECVRLAQLADDQQVRERLLQMARKWMAAAMDKKTFPKSKSSLANGLNHNLSPLIPKGTMKRDSD